MDRVFYKSCGEGLFCFSSRFSSLQIFSTQRCVNYLLNDNLLFMNHSDAGPINNNKNISIEMDSFLYYFFFFFRWQLQKKIPQRYLYFGIEV